MAELIIMDHSGDSRTPFTPDDEASVAAAMKEFKEHMDKGYFAAETVGGEQRLTRSFNPNAEKIVVSPQLIGG